MKLNNLSKTNYLKMRVGRGIGSGKGKTSGRGVRGKNLDQEWPLKVLKAGKCLFIELPKRGFKPIKKKNIAIINLQDINYFLKNKKIDAKGN